MMRAHSQKYISPDVAAVKMIDDFGCRMSEHADEVILPPVRENAPASAERRLADLPVGGPNCLRREEAPPSPPVCVNHFLNVSLDCGDTSPLAGHYRDSQTLQFINIRWAGSAARVAVIDARAAVIQLRGQLRTRRAAPFGRLSRTSTSARTAAARIAARTAGGRLIRDRSITSAPVATRAGREVRAFAMSMPWASLRLVFAKLICIMWRPLSRIAPNKIMIAAQASGDTSREAPCEETLKHNRTQHMSHPVHNS